MRVLFVTSEIATIFKRGGLGDVSYSLPIALSRIGVNVTVTMPYYVKANVKDPHCVGQIAVDFDGKRELVFVFKTLLDDSKVPVYLFRHPILNDYQGNDMAESFAFYSLCVVRLYQYAPHILGGAFDIIHCHDWHTALIPMILGENIKMGQGTLRPARWRAQGKQGKTLEASSVKTIITIHNLLYQGEASVSILKKIGLPQPLFHTFRTSWGETVKFLREGLDYADVITTVSETYAREIMEGGGFIHEVMTKRRDKIIGIINGIDQFHWDPRGDTALVRTYSMMDVYTGKAAVKKDLRNILRLSQADVPLFGFVGRLEPKQKGIDLVHHAVQHLSPDSYQLVILGTGDKREVKILNTLTKTDKNIAFVHTFDDTLARKIYAGSDVMLVPSKFEPCGLIQMIAMRYGSIPLVRATGGLADTVRDGVTGFVFNEYSSGAFSEAMEKAIHSWKDNPKGWQRMVKRVMKEDFSWDTSAKKYKNLYIQLKKD
jgi:starch synthase